jgi:hypothetical protein
MNRMLRPFWFLLAALFLFEAWIWDLCSAAAARLVSWIPWARFKAAIAAGVARLPPWLTLFVFVIPGLVLFPFKLLGLWLLGTGHPVLGVATFLLAKTVGVGCAAFLFEICRPKLLELAWFVRVHDWTLAARAWAQRQIAPFQRRIRILKVRLIARLRPSMRSRSLVRRWRGYVQARRNASR